MDLIDNLRNIALKADSLSETIQTEEATKNALILPFINALGYDVFNPHEVCPEYTADFGVKKGEKVDYAILQEGEPIILIECKKLGANLSITTVNQLFRYYATTKAKIGVLTDGVNYRFFADFDAENRMDERPFLGFDLHYINESIVAYIKKLSKSAFDVDDLLEEAEALRLQRDIKSILIKELQNPTDDFVKYLGKQIHDGKMMTQKYVDSLRFKVKKALHQFINERVNDRLQSAMHTDDVPPSSVETPDDSNIELIEAEDEQNDRVVITTDEETQGFYIVKSILRKHVDPERIHQRDTLSYFGVLLDDNNRKPICRLWFNTSQWYLGVLDEEKKEERIPISKLDDIYSYSDQIIQTLEYYIKDEKAVSAD